MYDFNYSLSDTDYLDFNKYQLFNAPGNKGRFIFVRLLLPVLFSLMVAVQYIGGGSWSELSLATILLIVVAAVWFFGFKYLLMLIVKSNIKSLKKRGKLPYGKSVRLQFDEDGIRETTELAESKIKYASIERIAVYNSAIYIFISSAQALLVPFSVFETEAQRKEFLAFVNEKKRP